MHESRVVSSRTPRAPREYPWARLYQCKVNSASRTVGEEDARKANIKEKGWWWSTKTRHCVAQLAGRDEGEKYPGGEIHCGTQREMEEGVEDKPDVARQQENLRDHEITPIP